MLADRRAEAAGLDQLEIERQARERGQAAAGAVGFILETEKTLRQHRAPRW